MAERRASQSSRVALVKKNESSAKRRRVIGGQVLVSLMPLTKQFWEALLGAAVWASMSRINKYGDRRSPCLRPR